MAKLFWYDANRGSATSEQEKLALEQQMPGRWSAATFADIKSGLSALQTKPFDAIVTVMEDRPGATGQLTSLVIHDEAARLKLTAPRFVMTNLDTAVVTEFITARYPNPADRPIVVPRNPLMAQHPAQDLGTKIMPLLLQGAAVAPSPEKPSLPTTTRLPPDNKPK